jgi:hypothetical protein
MRTEVFAEVQVQVWITYYGPWNSVLWNAGNLSTHKPLIAVNKKTTVQYNIVLTL